MTRAKWKGPHIDLCILEQERINQKVWSRSSIIPSCLINTIVSVYNGQEFKRIIITRDKIGFKFGEFSFTRKFAKKKKIIKSKLVKSKKKKN
jgi:ribosomal protein S19